MEKSLMLMLRSVLFVLFLTGAAHAAAVEVEIVPDVVYGHQDGLALTFDVLKPKTNANGAVVKVFAGLLTKFREDL